MRYSCNWREKIAESVELTLFGRIVSAGLIPLTIAPFAAGSLNPLTDSILCALLVIHSHIGFEYVYSPSHHAAEL